MLTNDIIAEMIAKGVEAGIKDAILITAKAKTPKPTKRKVGTRATSVEQMKDEVIHRMFKVMTKHTEQVQFAT